MYGVLVDREMENFYNEGCPEVIRRLFLYHRRRLSSVSGEYNKFVSVGGGSLTERKPPASTGCQVDIHFAPTIAERRSRGADLFPYRKFLQISYMTK